MLQTAESDVRELFRSWAHTHGRPYKTLDVKGYSQMSIWKEVEKGGDLNESIKDFLYASSNRFEVDAGKLLDSEIQINSTKLPKTAFGSLVRRVRNLADRGRYSARLQDFLYPILG